LSQYDRSLLEIFSAEQAEHIQRVRSLLDSNAAMAGEARPGAIEEILRRAHTLKGAGRAVGLKTTEQLAHQMEALVGRFEKSSAALDENSIAVTHRALDAMEDILAAAIAGRAEPNVSAVYDAMGAAAGSSASPVEAAEPEAAAPSAAQAATEYLRVDAANVDELIRVSSQLLALITAGEGEASRQEDAAQRAESAASEYRAMRRAAAPFLRAHADDLEAEPLRECLEFVDRELHAISGVARASVAAQTQRTWELRQRVTRLHQNSVRVRMIPAESVFGAFGTMVRQIAQEEGKRIDFRVEGLEVQADRVVLQALKDPVMHLLRNAVSHGIETPPERIARGKSSAGNVRLLIDAQGSRLHVSVEDDGRGLDSQAVRGEAIASGLLTEDEAAAAPPQQIANLIFRSGFSTSGAVTNISGRGVGLSIVKETADRLHGEVEVRQREPFGLSVTISVSLSISTQQLLLVEAGGSAFGMPTQFVRELTRARLSALRMAGGQAVLMVNGKPAPVARLSDLLELPTSPPPPGDDVRDPWMRVACLVWGEQTIGLIVDRFVDEREAMVKDLGLPRGASSLTAGGIPLEDGRVALVLNPGALLNRFRASSKRPLPPREEPQKEISTRRILVVDDSLTTRSLEKSILEANGFQVTIAVDGAEALEKLGRDSFDLVITDVVMPRMDGMQLLEQMKKQSATERIPVIMLTSMESQEHQQRGMSLGADAYIVKRKFDQQELLRTVRQIL
jgi:two-component system chemotaxis sensor kinase CheA